MSTNSKLLFSINGFDVHSGRIYKIFDKPDLNAPSGFIAHNATKLPSVGIGEQFSFRHIGGIWDTGFHPASPCYKHLEPSEVKKLVEQRVKNVLRPYQNGKFDKTVFEVENQASLDKPSFKVEAGVALASDDPEQLMNLYAALLGNKVAPKDKQHSPEYRLTPYLVEDTTKVSKQKHEVGVNKVRALRKFDKMYEGDPETLRAVLMWLGMTGFVEGHDIDTASSIFDEKITNDKYLTERFLKVVNEIDEKMAGHQKYYIHEKLKRMRGKSSKLVVGDNGRLFFNGTEVGPDLHTASENIAKNQELQGIRDEILTNGKVTAE